MALVKCIDSGMEKLIVLGVPLCKILAVLDYIYMLIFKLSYVLSTLELEWCVAGWGEKRSFLL